MINYIIINGTNSNTINGLGINELPPISKPPLRVQTEEIDGRDGDISTNLGYGAYDKTISIGLFGTGYDINEVISFFNGEGTVVFSNEPNKYYKYKIINQIDYEALLKFKSATITFHCQPFKYPLTETPLEIEYEYIEQEGVESATMNNTNGGTSLKIDLKGNTSQYTTTGKNICSSSSKIGNQIISFIPTKEIQKTFTLSFRTNETLLGNSVYLYINGQNGATIGYISSNGGYASITITLTDEAYNVLQNATTWEIRVYKGGSTNFNAPENAQIENSSSATSYEPYTNGASPNPDYPQQIHEVSGDNEIVVWGKNLFDIKNYSKSGWIMTIDNPLKNMSAGNYTISCQNKYITASKGVRIYFSNTISGVEIGNVFTDYNFGNTIMSETKSLTQEQLNASYMILYPNDNAGTQQVLEDMKIMIESGSSASPYEPYNGDTYELDLGVENLLPYTTYDANDDRELLLKNLVLPKGTYTISFDLESKALGTNSSFAVLLGLYPENISPYDITLITIDSNTTLGRKSVSFTTTENIVLNSASNIRIGATIYNNGARVKFSNLQIEAGTKANSYSPFGQTPIKMRGIGTYEDYFVRNSGKNLIQLNEINLSANSTTDLQLAKDLPIGTYNFNGINIVGDGRFNLYGVDENNTQENLLTNELTKNIGNGYSFTTTKIYKQVKIYVNVAISGKVQLEAGSSVSTYEPYGTGQWCKYNAIGSITLDGSENWSLNQTKTYVNQYLSSSSLSDNIATGTSYIMSDYFKYKQADPTDTTNEDYMWLFQNRLVLDIRKTIVVDTTALKTWTGTNRPTFCYQLATPYLSLIESTTLISQLDNIQNAMSYEGQTNISQVNNDKPFIISAKALEQGSDEVVVNNIGNATSKPLIALEGTGNINIYLDGTQVLQANVEDKMNIDIDKLEAYNPDTSALLNRQVTGNYNSMTLPSGNSTIKIDGALDKATITNYQRWL